MATTDDRSPTRVALAILASIGLLVSMLAMASPVLADGNHSSTECTAMPLNVDAQHSGQSEDEVTVDAGTGKIVTAICIKSGNEAFQNEQHSGVITANGTFEDCYTVAGLNTQTVTVTRADDSDCKGISHVDARTGTAGQQDDVNPDVRIEKSASASVVTRGENYTYTLLVHNHGDGVAENVHVQDDMDRDLNITAVTPSQGTCELETPSNDLDCWLGSLAAGASATIVIDVDTTDADCEIVNNRASVDADDQREHESETVQVTIECDDDAALKILKVNEDDVPLPGAVFTIEGMEGTFTTGGDGSFCITGLPEDTEWLVTEIQAPAGYEIADPASQMVDVDDDGDCDSPDAIFVNTLGGGAPTPTPTPTPTESASATETESPSTAPSEGELGGNPTPRPELPDTAMGTNAPAPWPLAVVFVMSLIGLVHARFATERAR